MTTNITTKIVTMRNWLRVTIDFPHDRQESPGYFVDFSRLAHKQRSDRGSTLGNGWEPLHNLRYGFVSGNATLYLLRCSSILWSISPSTETKELATSAFPEPTTRMIQRYVTA